MEAYCGQCETPKSTCSYCGADLELELLLYLEADTERRWVCVGCLIKLLDAAMPTLKGD